MSSKTKFLYILIGMLILLVTIRASFALQEDFNAYSGQRDVYLCSCGSAQNDLVIENIGDVTSAYSLAQSGTAQKISSIPSDSIILKPGERKAITNFFSAPCSMKGEYDLKTEFQTLFGIEKEISQKVIVNDCLNINLRMTEASVPVCPCSPAVYKFVIQNTADFVETYRLSIDNEFAEVSEDIIVLGPKQSDDVTVFITTPCGSYGTMQFVLTAETENSGYRAQLPFTLTVEPCYEYEMNALARYTVCQDTASAIPVEIKSRSDIANTYFIDTDTEWAAFDTPTLNMAGREERAVSLNMTLMGIEPANYNITINAVTARGEIRKQMSVAAEVQKCYSLNLISEFYEAQVVEGEKGYTHIYVENDGTLKNDYDLNITGPSWVSLEKGMATLEPGIGMDVKVYYDVPFNTTEKNDITVQSSIKAYPAKSKTVGIILDVVRFEDAHKIEIDSEDSMETNYDGKDISITISNTGIREGTYDLYAYSAAGALPWANLDKKSTTLKPGDSDTVNLKLTPTNDTTPEGKYSITVDAVLKDSGVAYTRTFDIRVREKTSWEKVKDFFASYWLYMMISLLSVLLLAALIIFLIIYRRKHPRAEKKAEEIKETPKVEKVEVVEKFEEKLIKEEKPRKSRWLLFLLLLLLLLLGAGILSYYYVYEPYFGNQTNATNQTFYQKILFWQGPEEPEEPEEIELPEAPLEPVTNATIFVNRTGLEGYGNIIEIECMKNITIPLVIQNSDEPNTYVIRVKESIDWVRTDKTLVNIPPSEKQTVNIYVEPTPEVEYGNYNLSITINVAGRKEPLSEEIVLSIKEHEPFYKRYMWYLIGGLAAMILMVMLISLKHRKDRKEEEELYGVKDKHDKKASAEEDKPSKLKNVLLIILLIIIILAALGAGAYFGYKAWDSKKAAQNMTEMPAEDEDNGEEGKEFYSEIEDSEVTDEIEEPEVDYDYVFVKKGDYTLIPIRITNANKTTTFKISMEKDVDWVYIEEDNVEIKPNEAKVINLVASPDKSVDDGNYKLTVNIDIANGEKYYTKYLAMKVRKNRYSDILSYVYYAVIGIAVLLVLMWVLTRAGRRKKDEEEEDAAVDENKKKRTNLRLK